MQLEDALDGPEHNIRRARKSIKRALASLYRSNESPVGDVYETLTDIEERLSSVLADLQDVDEEEEP